MKRMTIRTVVRLVGINENTLRSWERRYKLVSPDRAPDGRRLYSSQDVQKIKYLWALVQNGYAISLISSYKLSDLKKMFHELSPLKQELAKIDKIETYQNLVIETLEKFDIEALYQVLQKCSLNFSTQDIVIHLIQPLLLRVGSLIEEKKLSIAQEHILSTCLRDFLGGIYQSLAPYDFANKSQSKGVLLTTREGDFHEFGILLAAILCNLYRFRVYYLGPNMPVEDIIHTCEQFKIHFMILGLTALPKSRELISAGNFLEQLDGCISKKIQFWVGGKIPVEIATPRKIIQIKDFKFLDNLLEINI